MHYFESLVLYGSEQSFTMEGKSTLIFDLKQIMGFQFLPFANYSILQKP